MSTFQTNLNPSHAGYCFLSIRAIPEKNTWGWGGGGGGGRRQAIYFSMGGWCGKFSNYMGHWCSTKSNYIGGLCFAVWMGKKEYYLPKKREKFLSNLVKKRVEHSKPQRKRPFLLMPNRQNSYVSIEYLVKNSTQINSPIVTSVEVITSLGKHVFQKNLFKETTL